MRERLIAELLAEGYDVRVMVSGRSMAPSLRDGDIVTVRSTEAGALRRGDLVLRRDGSGDGLLLHRLVSVSRKEKEYIFVTRGDALLRTDRPARDAEVLGRVIAVERRRGGTVSLDRPGRRLVGRLLSFLAPLLALAVKVWSGNRSWPKSRALVRSAGVSPESEVLLAAAVHFSDGERIARAGAACKKIADWPALLTRARREGLTSLLATRLREGGRGLSVPGEVQKELSSDAEKNRRRCLFLFQEAAACVSRLGAAGITAVPFKGPVMADRLYGDVGARPAGDLDIVISRADAEEARRVMAQEGYRTHLPLEEREEDYVRHYYAWTLVSSPHKPVVDLHWELARSFCPAVLGKISWGQRLAAAQPGSQPFPSFGREDLLLLLAVHGGWHRWRRMIWLADVAALLGQEKEIDWDLLFSEAARVGMVRSLALGLILARDLLAAPLPRRIASRIAKERVATDLAAEVRKDFEGGRVDGAGALGGRTLFHLRLLDRRRDRLSYLLGWLFQPNINDWLWVRLPRPLSPLYRLLRPLRLGLLLPGALLGRWKTLFFKDSSC